MAGMLPGVECARRRRLHKNGSWLDSLTTSGWHASTSTSTRRSSFCLYTTNNHGSLLTSTSTSTSSMWKQKRDVSRHASVDDNLGQSAREAKERLDERLRAHWKSETKRSQSFEGRSVGSKKSASKRFNWIKN